MTSLYKLVIFDIKPGSKVLEALRKDDKFVRCLHAVGGAGVPGWPCDPARTVILHRPADDEIVSYGQYSALSDRFKR